MQIGNSKNNTVPMAWQRRPTGFVHVPDQQIGEQLTSASHSRKRLEYNWCEMRSNYMHSYLVHRVNISLNSLLPRSS